MQAIVTLQILKGELGVDERTFLADNVGPVKIMIFFSSKLVERLRQTG